MYKVVVFDLDLTLWICTNTWIDMSGGAPFVRIEDDVLLDQEGGRLELFKDVRGILELLTNNGYTLAVASRSGASEWAYEALEKLHLDKYFSEILIFTGSKTSHFERLKASLGCEYTEMLFFDDEQRNIDDLSRIGVDCVLVENGVKFSHILSLI